MLVVHTANNLEYFAFHNQRLYVKQNRKSNSNGCVLVALYPKSKSFELKMISRYSIIQKIFS